jgi:hypothetical protein
MIFNNTFKGYKPGSEHDNIQSIRQVFDALSKQTDIPHRLETMLGCLVATENALVLQQKSKGLGESFLAFFSSKKDTTAECIANLQKIKEHFISASSPSDDNLEKQYHQYTLQKTPSMQKK